MIVYYDQMKGHIQPKYFHKNEAKVLTSTIHVFCDVIDNFGDAGFCLRLSRDLSKKYQVELFCNNLEVLKKITNKEDLSLSTLHINCWPDKNDSYQVPDIVIEAFSCRAPEYLLEKYKKQPPLIIELEYLTAETFADDCHGLSSYSDGLARYFFFPGFSPKTGGIIFESELIDTINKHREPNTSKVKHLTLFSYHEANHKALIKALNKSRYDFEITLFEGLQLQALNKLLNCNLKVGDSYKLSNITFNVKKMVSQRQYDELLATSDFNLVRGEDSIVRAMLCGKPFLWNIYPQDEDAHKVKLQALFTKMREFLPNIETINQAESLNLSYNLYGNALDDFDFDNFYESWSQLCLQWSVHLQSLGSLTENLSVFIENKLK